MPHQRIEHMVEILCPHCEGEIELDDDASGEFECPLCGGEFEWNISPEVKPSSGRNQAMEIVSHPIQWFGLAFSVIMLVILILSLSATYYTAGDEEGFLDVNFKLSEFEFDTGGSAVSFDYSDSEKVLVTRGKEENQWLMNLTNSIHMGSCRVYRQNVFYIGINRLLAINCC